MNTGDKVTWTREWAGGYRWTRHYPAIVLQVNPKTVRIRVITHWERNGKPHPAVERNVKAGALSPRAEDCQHEALLA